MPFNSPHSSDREDALDARELSQFPGTPEWLTRNRNELVQKLLDRGVVKDVSELDALVAGFVGE
jgi:hypothetical protein